MGLHLMLRFVSELDQLLDDSDIMAIEAEETELELCERIQTHHESESPEEE